jgi:hypothetical protein
MKKTIITILITMALIGCQEPETDNTPILAGIGLLGEMTTTSTKGPEPEPTPEPTTEPTTEPTPEPTTEPAPEPEPEPAPEPEPEPAPEPEPEPAPEPEPEPRLPLFFTIENGENLFYYDGENLDLIHTGSFYIVDNETIVKEDILYKIDEYGGTVSSIQLPAVCDFVEEAGNDFYCIRIVPKSEALAFGAGNYNYAEIWKNYTKINDWWENKWLTSELIKTESGDIVAKTNLGAYYPISGVEQNIQLAQNDGIFIYNYNAIARTASIKTSSGIKNVGWSTNYMNDAKEWMLTELGYLAQNGYFYSHDTGLLENDTILTGFMSSPYPISGIPNGETATVIAAGKRYENSEDVTYWIECNTGKVIRYVRSIDTITTPFRLYSGDGTQATGNGYKNQIKPLIYGDDLYYNHSGTIYKLNLDTGLVSAVIAQNAKFYLMR